MLQSQKCLSQSCCGQLQRNYARTVSFERLIELQSMLRLPAKAKNHLELLKETEEDPMDKLEADIIKTVDYQDNINSGKPVQ